jgi:hypothetical protein
MASHSFPFWQSVSFLSLFLLSFSLEGAREWAAVAVQVRCLLTGLCSCRTPYALQHSQFSEKGTSGFWLH